MYLDTSKVTKLISYIDATLDFYQIITTKCETIDPLIFFLKGNALSLSLSYFSIWYL